MWKQQDIIIWDYAINPVTSRWKILLLKIFGTSTGNGFYKFRGEVYADLRIRKSSKWNWG